MRIQSQSIQTMDLTSLKAVVNNLKTDLVPSRFEKVQQTNPSTLQLGFRSLKGLKWIEISWIAEAPRIVSIKPPERNGEQSTLAKQIQSILRESALVEIKQDGFERIVELRMASRPGENIKHKIILELMGRHSNLFLVGNQDRVITLGKQIKKHHSRIRPIGTGNTYFPPPPLKGIKPTPDESETCWRE